MSYPVLQFVNSPASTATVRYDFNMSTAGLRTLPLGGDGLDFGVPSFSGEPEGVGGYYGYRQMRFTQRIIGSKASALGRMSLLAREMLRSTNWLRYQHDAGRSAVYFKTYRSEPGSLSLEWSETADAWDITIPLVADSFAYGERVTAATGIVITPNSTATNPMRYALPAIKGDAPTGLRVSITPGGTSATDAVWMIGCSSGDATMTDPINEIGTGDGYTSGSGGGLAVPSTNTAYSGGSYRPVTIAAASPNLLDRMSGASAPTGLVPGRYKILLRCELDGTATGKTFLFQYVQRTSGLADRPGPIASATVVANRVGQGWVDLGDFSFPFGFSPPSGVVGILDPSFVLRMGTADGSAATARIDAFKFIPVDGPSVTQARLLKMKNPTQQLNSNSKGTFDADTETYWAVIAPAGTTFREGAPELAGAYPIADPASAQNILFLVPLSAGSQLTAPDGVGTNSSVAISATVDVSYHPRYLHIGDGT